MEDDYSKTYLERTENGEESMLFLSIGSDVDLMMIRGLLFSENISSFCSNQHSSRVLGGWNIINPIKFELYILKSDYDTSKELLFDFAREYRGTLRLYDPDGNEIPIDISSKNNESSNDAQEIINNSQNAETAKISIDDVTQGNFFSFDGICTLRKYWFHFFISVLIVALDYGYSYLYKHTPYGLDLAETIICLIVLVGWNIHMICLAVQRMRSVGVNPWKVLIPIYGPVTVRFIPANKDQTGNKYLNYHIPGEKWLRVILIIFAIASSGASNFNHSKQNALKGLSENNSEKVVFSDEAVTCKRYKTEDGIVYYFNVYRYKNTVIDTVVFYKKETFNYLKNKYLEFNKSNSEEYLNEYCNFLFDTSSDYPYIELYDDKGTSIISFEPEEYESVTGDVIDEYGAETIRFWYFDFDEHKN